MVIKAIEDNNYGGNAEHSDKDNINDSGYEVDDGCLLHMCQPRGNVSNGPGCPPSLPPNVSWGRLQSIKMD